MILPKYKEYEKYSFTNHKNDGDLFNEYESKILTKNKKNICNLNSYNYDLCDRVNLHITKLEDEYFHFSISYSKNGLPFKNQYIFDQFSTLKKLIYEL
jgi:hypothetical protein